MKKLFFLVLIFPLISKAQNNIPQDSTILLSDYEYFSLQPGIIIRQEDSTRVLS
jgi:hypothetical protein